MTIANSAKGNCIDFHGIPIELSYVPFARDAFDAVFAGFGRRSATKDALRLELSSTLEACTEPPTSDWRPTFFYGLVQAYSKGDAHVLSDGESRLEVFPRLGCLSGRLFDGEKAQLAAGMQHIGLSLLLRERGVFDAHAAVACTKERAFVILGDSGAGKTTLLLALMTLGCDFLGDDRLLFRASDAGIELLAYPREFHVTPKTMRLLPGLAAGLKHSARADGKYPLRPLEFWPERLRKSWIGPISILMPRVAEQRTTSVRRATAAEAFGTLLSSSASVMVETFEHRDAHLRMLREFADVASACEVTLGHDLLSDAETTARRLLRAVEGLARES